MAQAGEKIGDWTTTTLVKFIQDILKNNPPTFSPNQTIEQLNCHDKLTITDQVQFLRSKTTVGAAGGASALPGNPAGYIIILDPSGNEKQIPYYNNG